MLNRKRGVCWRLRNEYAQDSDSRKQLRWAGLPLMRPHPTHRARSRIDFVVGPPATHAADFRYDLRGFTEKVSIFNIRRSYWKRTVLRGRKMRPGKFNSRLVFEIGNNKLSRNESKNTGQILFLMKKIRNRRK